MEKNRKCRNAFKRNLIAVAVASCFAADLAVANPTGPTVVAGQASFQQAGTLLSITNSPSSIINWRSFSIGASEITRFIQQSAASAVLNRVTGGDLSTILGALQSNGRVFLVNPTGIVIGSGARIDVAGFVASTLNLPDADFLAGRMRFIETPNAGSIVNQGAINAASGGNVYLVAPEITNSGIITSPRGEVILAAGKSVELVNPGTPGIRVEVTAPDNQAINLGEIVADSGRAGIYAGIISNRGVIRADTIAAGENGEILLRATKNITLEPGSVISASGAPGGVHDGGTVRIVADDTLDMQRGSAVRVDGGIDGGNGGFLELSGKQKIALNGEFTGRALKAGYKNGSLLLDPLNINIVADSSVLATVAVGPNFPGYVVVSPDGSRIYSGSFNVGFVTVIDTATNAVVATIPVAGAVAIAIKPDGTRVYAVDQTGPGVPGTLSVIDTATNTLIAIAATGYGSNHISMRPDGTKAYITNGNDSRLTVLNTADNTTVQVNIQSGPSGSAVTPNGAFVYANNGASNSVSVVNTATNSVVTTIGVGANPQWIVVRPDGARAYTANLSGNSVSVIDTNPASPTVNTVLATIGVGSQPRHIVTSPDGSRLYVTNGTGNSISVIDTATNLVVTTVPVGTGPSAASISPDGSRVFVTNRTTDNVSVISTATNTVVNTVPVGDDPIFSAARPDGRRVYVTNRLGPSVSVITLAPDNTGGDGIILAGESPTSTLDIAPSALNGLWSTVSLAALNNVSVLSPIGNADVNNGSAGGSLNLSAGNNVLISAPIGTSGTRFDHDLSLNAGNDVIVNSDIYLGNRTLTLAANVTALDGVNTTTGNVTITPTTAPVTVDTLGSIKVSGVDFNVLGGTNKAVTVTAGVDLIVGNHPDLGGGLPELTGRMLVQGGTASNFGDASATVHANGNVFIKAGSVEIRGGTADASALDNSFNTATANAEVSAGNNLKLITTSGGLTVAGGSATARAFYNGSTNNSATANANASLAATNSMTLEVAGGITVQGGDSAQASAYYTGPNIATANANASVTAGTTLTLDAASLEVRGGDFAWASASSGGPNTATVNANATLAATNSMTLAVAGGITVQGGDSAQASAYYTGPNIATANANASVTAGTTLTLDAASLEVRGGDSARASASSGGPNTATANANATLSSGGNMTLIVGTGGMRVRGGDNAFASASSGTTGLNTARIDANALVSSGGLLTLTVSGGGLTVRGGDNAVASNSSGDGLITALVNVKSSVLANAMDLTVTDDVVIRGGNSARALASCCNSSSAQNTATTTADALVRATNNLTLTINAGEGNSLTVAGGDNAKASGTEASGQSRNLTVNTNAELSAGGNLTVIMNNQGPVTVRGGDRGSSGAARASASSSALSVISTVNARGKMAAGGLVEIKGPAGLVTVRGGDNARASAYGSSIAVTSATMNVEGQITGGSVKITSSGLTVRGGNGASASATDNVGNTATITANGLLNATSALDLIISGAMNVAGGSAARATARYAGSGNTNQATTSAGALVTGGNITISAGSLTVSGGVQGSSDRAAFNGSSGANRATTLANANIVATGNLAYTGGPVTLQGGTARTQGSSGSANSAIAEASAGIQVAGTKTLNITGDLQILGGSALDSVVAPNVGSAVARAVLDPGALDATASGNVVLSDGTVTGTGSAYSAVIASGVTLQADGMSIGGTINAGGGTVILRPNSTTRNINIESGATSGVLSLNPSELQKITAGTLEIGRTTDTGTLSVNTALNTADVNAATLILQHQNISVNGDIGSAVTPFQHDLALLAGNGVSINNSIVLHSGGSLALVAATGDLDIMPSTVPTRVESLDMALLAGGNVNVGSASGTQSTTVLANRLLTVGAASNFTVRGGAEAGAFTSVGGGGLTVIATVGDVIVAGGGGSNASATVSGTPDVDMLVAGVVRLDAGTGTGASAAISAGSATSIRLELPNLESGGFFVNGQEGVVYDAATATGFLAGGAPAVLGQSLLVTYGGAPPPSSPPSTREPGVQQAINTIVQSTTEASRTGERTASQDAGPTEEEKQKEKEERARAVCN